MKTAAIPSVRVDAELRDELEKLLFDGETLSQFVESSVREGLHRRKAHAEFVARGLRSLEAAKASGEYVDADTALQKLERRLAEAKLRRTPVRS